MAVIIGLFAFAFLFVPLLLVVLAIKEHNEKVKARLLRQQNIADMKEAYKAALADQRHP